MSQIPHMSAPRPNASVCDALAKQLADAKRGLIQCVSVIAVNDAGEPNVVFAGEMDLVPSVNLGADILKATVLSQILGDPRRQIIRPNG